MRPHSPTRSLLSLLVATALCFLGSPAHAIVDDAHSAAMTLAAAHVTKGFRVREDYWKGELKSGQSKQIRAQLFKGNEYWFWAGLDADEGASVVISITDQHGKVLHAETAQGRGTMGARILPPRTGAYLITITVKTKGADAVPWAVAYGYR